jgi:hypothetical protein
LGEIDGTEEGNVKGKSRIVASVALEVMKKLTLLLEEGLPADYIFENVPAIFERKTQQETYQNRVFYLCTVGDE